EAPPAAAPAPPPATQAPLPAPEPVPVLELAPATAAEVGITEAPAGARPLPAELLAAVAVREAAEAPRPPEAVPAGPWGELPGDEAARPRVFWDRVRLGLLLVLIAACVGAGGFALLQIGLLCSTIDAFRLLSPPAGGQFPSGTAALVC